MSGHLEGSDSEQGASQNESTESDSKEFEVNRRAATEVPVLWVETKTDEGKVSRVQSSNGVTRNYPKLR